MIDHIEDNYSIEGTPRSRQISFDLAALDTKDYAKSKFAMDETDDISTLASSILSSHTIEEKIKFNRSESFENIEVNFDDLYDRAESFLDKEGLSITSPSPVLPTRQLKSSLTLPDFAGFNKKAQNQAQSSDAPKVALPSFLVKRVASSGAAVNSVKNNLLVETGMSKSAVCLGSRNNIVVPPRLSLS